MGRHQPQDVERQRTGAAALVSWGACKAHWARGRAHGGGPRVKRVKTQRLHTRPATSSARGHGLAAAAGACGLTDAI